MTAPSPAPDRAAAELVPSLDEYRAAVRFWRGYCMEVRAELDRQRAVVDAAKVIVQFMESIPASWKSTAFEALDQAEDTPDMYEALAAGVRALSVSDSGPRGQAENETEEQGHG